MSITLSASKPRSMMKYLLSGIVAGSVALTACTSTDLQQQPKAEQAIVAPEAQGYRSDLEELAGRIRAEHPRPFRFITEADFDELVAARVDEMSAQSTKREFLWAFGEILSAIECGHSRLPYFNQENALIKDEERFPLDVRLVGDRLYILDPLTNAAMLRQGDEIVSINGRTVDDVRAEIYRHIQAEGVATNYKVHMFNVYATSYLSYALGFPSDYEVTLSGSDIPVALQPLNAFELKPLIHPNDPCQETLCYRVDAASNAGIMTVHSFAFYGDRGQFFADFVDASLADASQNDRSALVIDIRFHDGGSGNAAAYILRRLTDAPFAYFSDEADRRAPPDLFELQRPVNVGLDVPLYLLVDGETVSSAPHFAALFKEHAMGRIVGETMGGGKSTNDGAQVFRSSVNDVEYKIARMRFDVAAPRQSLDDPVQPDIALSYTVGDVIRGEDSMMAFTLGLIGSDAE